MKRTKQKWYLFVDGKSTSITNNRKEVDILKGVVIEITADEAASIFALKFARMMESEVNE